MNHPRYPALLLAILIVACADDGPPAREAPTIDDFPAAIAGTVCDALFRCTSYPWDLHRREARDVATCSARLTALMGRDQAPLVALVHAGRVRYDPEAARRCFARIGGTCSAYGTMAENLIDNLFAGSEKREPPCAEAFSGTVPPGGACSRSEECTQDTWCDGRTDCLGTCRTRTPLGGTCHRDAVECQHAGLRGQAECHIANDSYFTSTCIDQVPASTPAGPGGRCGFVQTGTTGTIIPCANGYTCHIQRCIPMNAAGQPCGTVTTGSICVTGYYCSTFGYMPGTCIDETPLLVGRQAGQSCTVVLGNSTCSTWGRLACVGSQCVPGGDGRLGSPCAYTRGALGCFAGLYCDPATSTCVAARPVGTSCTDDEECASVGCSRATHTCAAQACL